MAFVRRGIPLIVGTAGGSGAQSHVDGFLATLRSLAARHGLRFKLATIYSDVERDTILDALAEGRIEPCGHSGKLMPETVATVRNPVAQLGTAPLIEALEEGADAIVAGRCCDTAIFAALPILRGFDQGLALHCAKIAECGALCARPAGANDSLLCRLYADSFLVEPLNPLRRCTPASVAAHSLYEQPHPESLYEPEGMVDMRAASFEQLDERAVRVSGTVLRAAPGETLKLEGAELKGYRAVTIARISDPATIGAIDTLQDGVRQAVAANLAGVASPDAYRLIFRRYGLDAATFNSSPPGHRPAEIGLVIEAVAQTQELADGGQPGLSFLALRPERGTGLRVLALSSDADL